MRLMGRFMWGMIVAITLTVGILAVAGHLLDAEQKASATVIVNGPAARVFKLLDDPLALTRWWPEIKAVQMDRAVNGASVAWWCDGAGRRHIGWLTSESVKDQRLVRATYDPTAALGWSGTWTYVLSPIPGDAAHLSVQLTETAQFPHGLQRMLAAKIFKRSKLLQKNLNALQAELAKP